MSESELHDGRFARIERLIGEASLRRLSDAFVVVVGLGAVGSYATEGLARAGVGRLRLVDFDEVRLSNINRQLYALESTIGRKKCELARERVLQINPKCQVEAMDCFVHNDTIDAVLAGEPDLVIDAIDSFTPKAILLESLLRREIPVISSMGAALRTDPTLVRVGPMQKVHGCPLAAKIRKALRKKEMPLDFTCVYSIEPTCHLPPEATHIGSEPMEDSLIRGRKRSTLGSLPTLTGIFGLTAANAAIQYLARLPDVAPVSAGECFL